MKKEYVVIKPDENSRLSLQEHKDYLNRLGFKNKWHITHIKVEVNENNFKKFNKYLLDKKASIFNIVKEW